MEHSDLQKGYIISLTKKIWVSEKKVVDLPRNIYDIKNDISYFVDYKIWNAGIVKRIYVENYYLDGYIEINKFNNLNVNIDGILGMAIKRECSIYYLKD